MQLGDGHWGDWFDVQSLSDKLNIGVLMFCDILQDGGRQCLYNIGAQREDYPFWIALWWNSPIHFRLAQLAFGDMQVATRIAPTSTAFSSFWPRSELPNMLFEHYQFCNRLSN